MGNAAYVYHPDCGDVVFSEHHPFRPARYKSLLDLLSKRELLSSPNMCTIEPAPATLNELMAWHTRDYIEALARVETEGFDPEMLRFGIGRSECPVFEGLFRYVALSTGATLTACRGVADGTWDVAFSPASGMHHAFPDYAEGFCYVNDVVLGARLLTERGLRVAVVDLDAHHGNGTQSAFYQDDRVLTVSMHESGETLYPWGGFADELGEGPGAGFNVNVPLPRGCDDDSYLSVFHEIVPPIVARFQPDVILLVVGGDILARDPLTHLRCTNHLAEPIVNAVRALCPKIVMFGCGGYDEMATVNYWALAWAALTGQRLHDEFAGLIGGVLLGSQDIDGGDLLDMRVQASGPEKERIVRALAGVASSLKIALNL
jgi:acetoin utilization protein AcuC